MSDLEPLPQDLHQLFADERSAYADDDAARARVMRRLETAVVFAGVAAGIAGAGVAGLAAAGGELIGVMARGEEGLALAGDVVGYRRRHRRDPRAARERPRFKCAGERGRPRLGSADGRGSLRSGGPPRSHGERLFTAAGAAAAGRAKGAELCGRGARRSSV